MSDKVTKALNDQEPHATVKQVKPSGVVEPGATEGSSSSAEAVEITAASQVQPKPSVARRLSFTAKEMKLVNDMVYDLTQQGMNITIEYGPFAEWVRLDFERGRPLELSGSVVESRLAEDHKHRTIKYRLVRVFSNFGEVIRWLDAVGAAFSAGQKVETDKREKDESALTRVCLIHTDKTWHLSIKGRLINHAGLPAFSRESALKIADAVVCTPYLITVEERQVPMTGPASS